VEITDEVPNVFSALQKYGSSASENYLTESFVYLIQILLQRDRDTGFELLNLLGGKLGWFGGGDAITVLTQVTLYDKNPTTISVVPYLVKSVAILDIKVEQGDRLLYIEVKHDSPLGENQLEIDLAHLQNTGKAQTQMVLLSRSKSDALVTTLSHENFHHVCWYEIHNFLAAYIERDPICGYFVKSFVRFLEEKAMSLTPITSAYLDGVQGLIDLTRMLEIAFAQAVPSIKTKRIAGWSYRGLAFAQYWCGFRYDKPFFIVFENNVSKNPIYHRKLDLREAGFLLQGGDQQFESLVHFIKQAYEIAPVLVSDAIMEQNATTSDQEIPL
jgi:hypothetical protein